MTLQLPANLLPLLLGQGYDDVTKTPAPSPFVSTEAIRENRAPAYSASNLFAPPKISGTASRFQPPSKPLAFLRMAALARATTHPSPLPDAIYPSSLAMGVVGTDKACRSTRP